MKKYILLLSLVLHGYLWNQIMAQSANGIIRGRVFNANSNEPVPFATVLIYGTQIGAITDYDGNFLFTGIQPGFYQLQVSSIGFEGYISPEIFVTNAKNVNLDIPLAESKIALEEVVVKASPFRKKVESPVSLRRIEISEIEKSPGSNRDISKVIRSFPGVSSGPAFRNDIIVRGGGPSENRFYLDGVEIPNLNHFATQGASGGPVGIINVDFLREVNYYSGAFPANFGNTLSSVFDLRQIDGNKEKLKFRGTVGASDLALTLDGPLGEKTNYIFSVRRSYLQFLFALLELPFLPTYNDFQFKVRSRLNQNSEITFIGIGALDQFSLNLKANETPEQRYILRNIPVNKQWTYTFGAVYKYYRQNGYDTYVLSRNMLNNVSYKHENNNEDAPRTFDYSSVEAENKFRFEHNSQYSNGFRINYGLNLEQATLNTRSERLVFIADSLYTAAYNTDLTLYSYGLFGQLSRNFLKNRLSASLGLRLDGNNYSSEMQNPLTQFSPRFSISYAFTDKLSVNANSGRYYQRPPLTTLGYKDANGNYVNRQNNIAYIRSDHMVMGFEYQMNNKTQFTLEGFYKWYANYPFSIRDSVSLASKGADFGTFGDEAVLSIAKGRAYGFELLGRSRDFYGFNVILSYTLVRSESMELDENLEPLKSYIPTSRDNVHILNITTTKKLKRNWDIGLKWRFVGGTPYTPFDFGKSEIRDAWDAQNGPYLLYSSFNSERLNNFHQLDLRIDKQYFFNKWSLLFYLDIQNIYGFKSDEPDPLIRESDLLGTPPENDLFTQNGTEKYRLVYLKSEGQGTILPTLGIIVEF